jgi:hypothetical protein
MPAHVLLNQFSTAAAPNGAALASGRARRIYRALDPAPGSATVEYFGDLVPAPGVATTGFTASYACREVSDSGEIDETPPILMMVAFDVPAHRTEDVERWYAEEHIPLLCRAPGWRRARRYEVREWRGAPRYTSIALHELRDVQTLDSPERAYARATAWRAAMQDEPWFRSAGRFLYQRVE